MEKEYKVGEVSFTMISVEGGTFNMGCDDAAAYDNEKNVRAITLTDYFIGKHPVTQELWKAVMGNNPSWFKGINHPVENISWNDCLAFIDKLSEITQTRFALPSEAQWEFAARGGNGSNGYKYSGSNEIEDVAWFTSNSAHKTHPIGQKKPNELGIYDMSGNVWEWCGDIYDKEHLPLSRSSKSGADKIRVNRGGSWFDLSDACRVSLRNFNAIELCYDFLGLRLALNP